MQLLFVLAAGLKGREAMEKKITDQTLQQRIKSGKIRREDVARRLAELAFGKVNDCVRLVLEDDPAVEKLDLAPEKVEVLLELLSRNTVTSCVLEEIVAEQLKKF